MTDYVWLITPYLLNKKTFINKAVAHFITKLVKKTKQKTQYHSVTSAWTHMTRNQKSRRENCLANDYMGPETYKIWPQTFVYSRRMPLSDKLSHTYFYRNISKHQMCSIVTLFGVYPLSCKVANRRGYSKIRDNVYWALVSSWTTRVQVSVVPCKRSWNWRLLFLLYLATPTTYNSSVR